MAKKDCSACGGTGSVVVDIEYGVEITASCNCGDDSNDD